MLSKVLKLSCVSFFLCISAFVQAQVSIGLSGGVNLPVYNCQCTEHLFSAKLEPSPSYNFKVLLGLKFNDVYHQQFGFGFDRRNYYSNYSSGDALGNSKDTTNTTLYFVNFDFINKFKLSKKIPLDLGFGLSLGKLTRIYETGVYHYGSFSTDYTYDYDGLNYDGNNFLDVSLLLATTYSVNINSSVAIQFDAIYKKSLLAMENVTRNSRMGIEFNDFRINIGILKTIKSKKKKLKSIR